MLEVSFYQPHEIADELFKFAVVAAKYDGKWIFCRHTARTTWEIPGGHREANEAIEDTARRELYEESGAHAAVLRPISAYSVKDEAGITYGMLYLAEVDTLSPLPEAFEIAEIRLCVALPESLTYPLIQPKLHNRVQGWLNLQSSADELWDVYDINRVPTGRLHRRADPMAEGDYHIVVHVWVRNSRGEFLITQRSPNKGFPNMWETTGGSAVAGDNSLSAAIREVKEETGLTLLPENGHCLLQLVGDCYFADIWLFEQEFDLDRIVLQEGETINAMAADRRTVSQMLQDGLFVPYSYRDAFWAKVDAFDRCSV